ncbi:MAG: endonuclease/exonuclease/phosphatase family protein [Desulfobacterales bacterium]|nr:endonuclease/exonuclease/phosphatase family protein [Desulfobacterales bacterium]
MTLKVATYNIHSCIDTARAVDMEKIAEVIKETGADVVALQEVDADKPRTGGVDQAKWLAERLGMDHFFYPVVRSGKEKYGLAVLSLLPMEKVKFERLLAPAAKKPREVRGAMWIRLKTAAGSVNLINTHLGLRAGERRIQIGKLLGDSWLGAVNKKQPSIFCGDFNAGRRSYVYRRVCKRFSDVQRLRGGPASPRPTFLSFYPIWCLDHIFVSDHFSLLRMEVPSTRLARRASDHLPVFAELALTASKKDAA